MTKGIILAGGTGSRLGALSKVTNKHLLPCGQFPMIFHPISQLLANNITDICIVSGTHHLGSVVDLLGSGSKFGCKFTYKVQDIAGGIAEALGLCRDFAGDSIIAVFLGDNIFEKVVDLGVQYDLANKTFATCANLFTKKVPDPYRFGVAEVDSNGYIIGIEEKPQNPQSDLAVVGVYMYNSGIWSIIKGVTRAENGELEISDANLQLVKMSGVNRRSIEGWWLDAGTPQSYKEVNVKVWEGMSPELEKVLKMMMKAA